MLTHLVIELVLFVIAALADTLFSLIPDFLQTAVQTMFSDLGGIMSYTPGAVIIGLITAWFAVDTALNAVSFGLQAFNMLPMKAS